VVEREGHVPRHRGENGEDRGEFEAEFGAGEQVDERGDGHCEKAEDRDGLQDVQQRDEYLLGAPQAGGRGGVDEGEQDGNAQRDEHAQQRARRVVRQVGRVGGHRGGRGLRQERRVQRRGQPEQPEQQRQQRGEHQQVDRAQPGTAPHAPRREGAKYRHRLPPERSQSAAPSLSRFCITSGAGRHPCMNDSSCYSGGAPSARRITGPPHDMRMNTCRRPGNASIPTLVPAGLTCPEYGDSVHW